MILDSEIINLRRKKGSCDFSWCRFLCQKFHGPPNKYQMLCVNTADLHYNYNVHKQLVYENK